MAHPNWQTWWSVAKVLLTILILGCVAYQFAHVLSSPELWDAAAKIRPGWCVIAAGLYLLGIGCSALYWYGLLETLGQPRPILDVLRAYYIGQLGRYVPGKVIGVVFRAQLLSGGRGGSAAVLTIIYEALTTLAAGALLAAVVLALGSADPGGMRWRALALVALLGIPLLPPVYNRVIRRVTARFPETDGSLLPPMKKSTLALGLVITSTGWGLQGASLWAVLQGLLPEGQPWSWVTWANDTGFVALATAVGFLVVTVPGGLGVRELILQQFLAANLAPLLGAEQAVATSAVAALLLRVVWSAADLTAAGVFALVPARAAEKSLPGELTPGEVSPGHK
jgi:uncharacterized membrane protein YbhN (UPF0104 family)